METVKVKESAPMFRITIAGRTFDEMRTNVRKFLNETGNDLTASNRVSSTDEIPFGAPDGMPTNRTESVEQPFSSVPPIPTPQPVVSAPTQTVDYGNVDSRGVPWDERVHSSSKATNKDGSWRSRRGIEPEQLKKIEAELLAGRPGSSIAPSRPHQETPAQIAPVPPPPVVPSTPVVPQIVAQPTPPPPQVITQAPPIPVPAPTSMAGHTLETFRAQLVPTLATLVKEGKLTQAYINQLKTYFGVEQIWEVNEQQLSEMFEQFVNAGLIAKVG